VRAFQETAPNAPNPYRERLNSVVAEKNAADRAKVFANVGIAQAAAGDVDAGVLELKRAMATCADCEIRGDLHKNLGLIQARAGDLQDAEIEFRAALVDKPDDPEIKSALQLIGHLLAPHAQATH